MLDFFKTLSRGTLAFLIIGIAIVLIVLNDPPHDLCDSEMDQLLLVQNDFINPSKSLKKAFKKANSPSVRLFKRCEGNQSSGNCLDYFIKLKDFSRDFSVLSRECRKKVYGNKKIKTTIDQALNLMVEIAWKIRSGSEVKSKYGWYDQADISLYCKYRDFTKSSMSESAWDNYQQKIIDNLEGADELPRDEMWKSTLLSVACSVEN